jgi:large subunit ribosomal protein L24
MERKKNKQPKLNIRKGDTVKVMAGDSRGQQAKVILVLPEKNRAVVEGVNMVKKHSKPSAADPQGGIVEKESTIHVSNLMIVTKGIASRIGRKLDAKGKLVRYSKKSGEEIK